MNVSFELPYLQYSSILAGDLVVALSYANKYKSTFLRNVAAFAVALDYPTSFVSCQHSAAEEEQRIYRIAESAWFMNNKQDKIALRMLEPFRAPFGTSFCERFTIDALLDGLAVDTVKRGTKLILVDAPEILFPRDPEQAEQEIRRMKLFCLAHSVSMILTAQASRRGYEISLDRGRWSLGDFKCAAFACFADIVIGLLADFCEDPECFKIQCIKSHRACPPDTVVRLVPKTGELRLQGPVNSAEEIAEVFGESSLLPFRNRLRIS